jgi:50S ribosomal subunit-associated GTPase HflX
VKSFSTIRGRLTKVEASMPVASSAPGKTSEEMIREVHRLLAEVEANPSAEVEPWNPADYPPEVVAMVEQVERMQKTMVWSDQQGCFVEPGTVRP